MNSIEIIDKVGLPKVCEFVKKKLSDFDVSKLDWFKLLPSNGYARWRGRHNPPKRTEKGKRTFVHQHRVRCSINIDPSMWPFTCDQEVGSKTIYDDNKNPLSWDYIFEEVMFASAEEGAVFLAGHEVFHFLRNSKQVPGRNGEPGANRYGIEWLKEFRERNQ